MNRRSISDSMDSSRTLWFYFQSVDAVYCKMAGKKVDYETLTVQNKRAKKTYNGDHFPDS
jgi:hypothetical protein